MLYLPHLIVISENCYYMSYFLGGGVIITRKLNHGGRQSHLPQ